MRAAALVAVLAVLLGGCRNERAEQLRAEIAELEESRMERSLLERAIAEADAAEADLAAAEAAIDRLRDELAERGAAAVRTEVAIHGEIARNEEIRAEIERVQGELVTAADRRIQLQMRVDSLREQAAALRDQAGVLARELRPEDPVWSQQLRLKTLQELLPRVAEECAGDAFLCEVTDVSLPRDPGDATLIGAELAAGIRDRLTRIYALEDGLPTSNVSAPPPTP